eukprot:c25300_g3_i3 orf=166-3042(-)
MARGRLLFHTLLLAIFLILSILQASRCSAQEPGFQSINCGGDAYNDSSTGIYWEQDPLNTSDVLFGRAGNVASNFQNVSHEMTTLRYFPQNKRISKYCYSLQVSNESIYLVRASFLYGNYDRLNKPPSFVLLVNYDVWTNVTTSQSANPVMHELTFVSNGYNLSVCLAPHSNSTHTPFISTLELRPLESKMYNKSIYSSVGGWPNALLYGHGLMLWRRINYGAKNSIPIRYPTDRFDRIWEPNTTGPIISSTNMSKLGSDYTLDRAQPPAEVMATAITTLDPTENLTFVFEGFGGYDGFLFQMHFEELNETAYAQSQRNISAVLPNAGALLQQEFQQLIIALEFQPVRLTLDQQAKLPIPFQPTLYRSPNSSHGPLLNALELFHWTPQPLSPTGTSQDDVDAIIQVLTNFKVTGYGQGDPCTPKSFVWTIIACNQDPQPKIVELNLSSFNLIGDIPLSINKLAHLQKLDLSNNMLSGEISNFSDLIYLTYLDLSNNKLNGNLPNFNDLLGLRYLNVENNELCGSTSSFQAITNSIYNGNPKICNDKKCPCSLNSTSGTPPSSTQTTRKRTRTIYVYLIYCTGALYIMALLALVTIYMAKRRRESHQNSALSSIKKGANSLQDLDITSKLFTYKDICHATLDFTNILGEGGFGKVYHGILESGDEIAVKILAEVSNQGLKQFSTEVATLSRVYHKNLVSLIGYCIENTYMLIYEYIPKGNLRDFLYGEIESTKKPLPWRTRLEIAIDASQGLEYLHTGCDPAIIHRDVKSSNILLTDKMQAKVGDFGLSRFKDGGSTVSHVSTVNVVGTAGYLDPAYNATNQLTDKSDVYSFGVVLFELICGRAPIDIFSSPPHIVDWVTPTVVHGNVEDIVDPMLANGYNVESMWKVVDVAIGCVQDDRMQRPSMSDVAQILREALEVEMDPKPIPISKDVTSSSSSSDGRLPILQYIENLRVKLQFH